LHSRTSGLTGPAVERRYDVSHTYDTIGSQDKMPQFTVKQPLILVYTNLK
jgi:hypothetical protein